MASLAMGEKPAGRRLAPWITVVIVIVTLCLLVNLVPALWSFIFGY